MALAPWTGRFLSLSVAGCLALGAPLQAAPPEKGPYYTEKYVGASVCFRCHTDKTPDDPDDFVLMNEFTTWKIQDKHSLAYAALESPRGQNILGLLGGQPGRPVDATKQEACLNCHTLHAPNRLDDPLAVKDGVSCETCHGPAQKWVGPHATERDTWRRRSAEEKYEAFGMYDLRSPGKRAELCFSCHIGNADQGKVVTHAMFAAGHPPLRSIEVAHFSANMPAHWRPVQDVPYLRKTAEKMKGAEVPAAERQRLEKILDDYGFTTADSHQGQLVLATSMAGLGVSMRLVAERSAPSAANSAKRWPELAGQAFDPRAWEERWPELALAHSDCYACHHELTVPSWRQRRGYPGAPGRPPVRPWPLALAELGVRSDIIPGQEELVGRLRGLAEVCGKRPFGDPKEVAAAARNIAPWPQGLDDLKRTRVDRLRWMRKLCALPADTFVDFESARQIVAALSALESSYPKAGGRFSQAAAFRKTLGQLEQELNVTSLAWAKRERIRLLAQLLAELANSKELLQDDGWITNLDAIATRSLDEAFAGPLAKTPDRQETRKSLERFLATVRAHGGRKLTASFLQPAAESKEPTYLQRLQAINDKEFEEGADKMSRYDPARFAKALSELSALLPDKPGF